MSDSFRKSKTRNSSISSSSVRRKRSILPSNTFVSDNDIANLSEDWWMYIPEDVIPKRRRVSVLTDNSVVHNLESPFPEWHRYINRRKVKVPESNDSESLSDLQKGLAETEDSPHGENDEKATGSRNSSVKSNLQQGSPVLKSRRRVKHSNNRFKDFTAENSDLGSSPRTVSQHHTANLYSSLSKVPIGQDLSHLDIAEESEEGSTSVKVSLKRAQNKKKNVKSQFHGSPLGLNTVTPPKSILRKSSKYEVNDSSGNLTSEEDDLKEKSMSSIHKTHSTTRNRFRDLQMDYTDITEDVKARKSVECDINDDAVVAEVEISGKLKPRDDQEPSNLSVSKSDPTEENFPNKMIQTYINKTHSNAKNRFLDLEINDSDTTESVRSRGSMRTDVNDVSSLVGGNAQSKGSNPKGKRQSSYGKAHSNANNRFCDLDSYDSDSTEPVSLRKLTKHELSNSVEVHRDKPSASIARNSTEGVELSNLSASRNIELRPNNSKENIYTSTQRKPSQKKNRFHDLEINYSDTTESVQTRRSIINDNEVSNLLISENYLKQKNRHSMRKTHSNTNNRFCDLEINDSDTTESFKSKQSMTKDLRDASHFLISENIGLEEGVAKEKTRGLKRQTHNNRENRFQDLHIDDSDTTEASKFGEFIPKNVNTTSKLPLCENASQVSYPDSKITLSNDKTPVDTENRFIDKDQFLNDSGSGSDENSDIFPVQSSRKSSSTVDSTRKISQNILMGLSALEKVPAKSNSGIELSDRLLSSTRSNLIPSSEKGASSSDEEVRNTPSDKNELVHSSKQNSSTVLTFKRTSRSSLKKNSVRQSPTNKNSTVVTSVRTSRSSSINNSPRPSPRKKSSTVSFRSSSRNSSVENTPKPSPMNNSSTVLTSGRTSRNSLVENSSRPTARGNSSTVIPSERESRSSLIENSQGQSTQKSNSTIVTSGKTSRNSSVENSSRPSPRKNTSTVVTSDRTTRSTSGNRSVENSSRPSPRKNTSTVVTSDRTTRSTSGNRSVENSSRPSPRKNTSTVVTSDRTTRSTSRSSSRNSSVKNSPRPSPRKNSPAVVTSGRTSRSNLTENSLRHSPRKNSSTVSFGSSSSSVKNTTRPSRKKDSSTVITSEGISRSSLIENSRRQSSSSDSSIIFISSKTSKNSLTENSSQQPPTRKSSTVVTCGRTSRSSSRSSSRNSSVENSPRPSPRKNSSTVVTSSRTSRGGLMENSPRQSLKNHNSTIVTSGRPSRNSSVEKSPKPSQRKNSSTILTSGRTSRGNLRENSLRPFPRRKSSTVTFRSSSRNSSVESSPRLSPRKNSSTLLTSGRTSRNSSESSSGNSSVENSPRPSARKNSSTVVTSGVTSRRSSGSSSRNSSVDDSPGPSPRKNSSTVVTSGRTTGSNLTENSPRQSPRKKSSAGTSGETSRSKFPEKHLEENLLRQSPRKKNSTVVTSGVTSRKSSGRSSRNSSVDDSPGPSPRKNSSTVVTSGRTTGSNLTENSPRQSPRKKSSAGTSGETSRSKFPEKHLEENLLRQSPRKKNSTVVTSGITSRKSSGRSSRNSAVDDSPGPSPRKNSSTVVTSGRTTGSNLTENSPRQSPRKKSSAGTSGETSKSKFPEKHLEENLLRQSARKKNSTVVTSRTTTKNSLTESSPTNASSVVVTSKKGSRSSLIALHSREESQEKGNSGVEFSNQTSKYPERKSSSHSKSVTHYDDEEVDKSPRQFPKKNINSTNSTGRTPKSSFRAVHSLGSSLKKGKIAMKYSDESLKKHNKTSMSSEYVTNAHGEDPPGSGFLENNNNNSLHSSEDESPAYEAYGTPPLSETEQLGGTHRSEVKKNKTVTTDLKPQLSSQSFRKSLLDYFVESLSNSGSSVHSKDRKYLKSSVDANIVERSNINVNELGVQNRSAKSLGQITNPAKVGETEAHPSINYKSSGNLKVVSAASPIKSQKESNVDKLISRLYAIKNITPLPTLQQSPVFGTLRTKLRNKKIIDPSGRLESRSNNINVSEQSVSVRKEVNTEIGVNRDEREFQKDDSDNGIVKKLSLNEEKPVEKMTPSAVGKSAHDTQLDFIDKNSSVTSNFTEKFLIPIAHSTVVGNEISTPRKSTLKKMSGSKSATSRKLSGNYVNASNENLSGALNENASANNSSDSEFHAETFSSKGKTQTLSKSSIATKIDTYTSGKSRKKSFSIDNPVHGSSQRKMSNTNERVEHESRVKMADVKKGQKEVNKVLGHLSSSTQNISPHHLAVGYKKRNPTPKKVSLKRKSSLGASTANQSKVNYDKRSSKLLRKLDGNSNQQRRDSSSSGMSVGEDDALESDSSDDTLEKYPELKKLLEEYTKPSKNADVMKRYAPGTLPRYFLPARFNPVKRNIKDTQSAKSKPTKPRKPVNPDMICDGIVYKKPRLAMPAPWVNKRLYKKVAQVFGTDLEENDVVSYAKVEEYVVELHKLVKSVLQHRPSKKKGNGDEKALAVMTHLYKAKLIKTKMEFYRFCRDYLPGEFLARGMLYPFPNSPSTPLPKDGFLSAKYLFMDLNL